MPRVISVYGPDLGGKTMLSKRLLAEFPNAAHLETNRLIRPTDNPIEKGAAMADVYTAVGRLLSRDVEAVILDGDPMIETLTDGIRMFGAQRIRGLHGTLRQVTDRQMGLSADRIAVHATIGASDTPIQDRVAVLAARANTMGAPSEFMTALEQRIPEFLTADEAYEELLRSLGEPVVRVQTETPYDLGAVVAEINQF